MMFACNTFQQVLRDVEQVTEALGLSKGDFKICSLVNSSVVSQKAFLYKQFTPLNYLWLVVAARLSTFFPFGASFTTWLPLLAMRLPFPAAGS